MIFDINIILTIIGIVNISGLLYVFYLLTDKNRIIGAISKLQSEDKKITKKRIKSYCPNNFEFYEGDSKIKIGFSELLQIVRGKKDSGKAYILVGEGGIGKSACIEYLMYRLALRNNLKYDDLTHKNISYINLSRIKSLEKLESKIQEIETEYTFLDAFDEFLILREDNSNPEDVIRKIANIILEENSSKFIISSRLEIFMNGIKSLNGLCVHTNFEDDPVNLKVIKINRFKDKSILKLYKSVGGSDSDKILRGKHYKLMRDYLAENKESIFGIPFFIKYADELLKLEEFRKGKWDSFKTYDSLINLWITREYKKTRKKINLENDINNKSDFISHYKKVLKEIAVQITKKSLDKKPRNISSEEITDIYKSHKNYLDYNTFFRTHFLRQIDEKEYEFFHFSIYEFLLSEILLNCSFKEKRELIKEKNTKSLLINFYANRVFNDAEIIEKIKDNIVSFRRSGENFEGNYIKIQENELSTKIIEELVFAEEIKLKDKISCKVKDVFNIFPLVKKLRYLQYTLNEENIIAFALSGDLNLSGQRLEEISGIEKFGDFKEIDLSENMIEDFTKLKPLCNLKLDSLDIHGNDFIRINEIISDIKADTIWIDLKNEKDTVIALSNKNVKKFNFNFPLEVEILKAINKKISEKITIKSGKSFGADEISNFINTNDFESINLFHDLILRISLNGDDIFYMLWFYFKKIDNMEMIELRMSILKDLYCFCKDKNKRIVRISEESFLNVFAATCQQLGNLYHEKDFSEAQRYYLEAYNIRKELKEKCPEDINYKNNFAFTCYKLGELYHEKDFSKAERYYLEAYNIKKELKEKCPEDINYKNNFAFTCHELGALYQENDFSKAERYYLEAYNIKKELKEKYPEDRIYKYSFAVTCQQLGNLYNEKDFSEAQRYYLEAYENYKDA